MEKSANGEQGVLMIDRMYFPQHSAEMLQAINDIASIIIKLRLRFSRKGFFGDRADATDKGVQEIANELVKVREFMPVGEQDLTSVIENSIYDRFGDCLGFDNGLVSTSCAIDELWSLAKGE